MRGDTTDGSTTKARGRHALVATLTEESAKGFGLVAEVARRDEFARLARGIADDRMRRARLLDGVRRGRHWSGQAVRLAAEMHRTWIRVLAAAGDGAVLDESLRVDASLARAITRALESRPGPANRELLEDLWGAVTRDGERLRLLRADLADGRRARAPRRTRARRTAVEARTGTPVSIAELRSDRPMVLTFVSRLNRKSREMLRAFNRSLAGFSRNNTVVVAVAQEPPAKLGRVADADGLAFPVVSDPRGDLAESVNALGAGGDLISGSMLVGSEGDTLFVAVAQSGGGHAERMLAVVERYRTRFPAAMGVSAL